MFRRKFSREKFVQRRDYYFKIMAKYIYPAHHTLTNALINVANIMSPNPALLGFSDDDKLSPKIF